METGNTKKPRITTLDDLFGIPSAPDAGGAHIQQIELRKLHEFEGHPFKVLEDQALLDMAKSIQEIGQLTPAIARPLEDRPGEYELVSGNRRHRACLLAGLTHMRVIVKEMTRDEAIIQMVDANLQREHILPSERAMAYKMKLEAIKRQGMRTDLTCVENQHKLKGKKSRDIVAEQAGESADTLEEQPYSGYGVASPVSVTISEENILALPKAVTVENEPLAVEIYKEDAFTGQPMGASFTLLDESGEAVSLYRMADGSYRPIEHAPEGDKAERSQEDRADAEETEPVVEPGPVEKLLLDAKTGKARIAYLTEGTYHLVEDPVPGYIALSEIEFELKNTHTNTLPLQCTVSNLPTRFLLEKQDGVTKQPLPGAKFKLTDEAGNVFSLVRQEDGTYRPALEGETGMEILELTNEKAQAVICYLPAGKVTVTEVEGPVGYSIAPPITTEVGTEIVLHTAVQAQKEDATAPPLAETSLAVVDLPLALKISKVHSKTQKPLSGAGFQLKAEAALSTPLRFTVKDGVYWYDPDGSVTTIEAAGDNCEAFIYGIPAGKYQLEETVVPEHFFPAPPVAVEITLETTSETPREVVVTNTPQVKLGIDADKFNVVIAMALTLIIGSGVGIAVLVRYRRKRNS